MQSLMENKAGKNLHLEHIEDEILNFGVPGGRAGRAWTATYQCSRSISRF